MNHKTLTCAACERPTVRPGVWAKADETERTMYREAGMIASKGRGLCSTCYQRAYDKGTLGNYGRTTVPQRDVLDDWQALAAEREGMSQAAAIRLLAPRMGMSESALEKALLRAGVRNPAPEPMTRPRRLRADGGCRGCAWRNVNLTLAEDDLRGAARRLAANPDSSAAVRILAEARETLAEARAAMDWHTDAEHGMEAAA